MGIGEANILKWNLGYAINKLLPYNQKRKVTVQFSGSYIRGHPKSKTTVKLFSLMGH